MARVSIEQLPEKEKAYAKRVCDAYESAKDRHEFHRRRWEHHYALYRSYRDLKRTYEDSSPRDVDSILGDARVGFGTDLFIPYVFSVIETTLPRMLSANPQLLMTPAPQPDLASAHGMEANVDTIKLVIDRQQTKTKYPLGLQSIGKSGLTYGLGVGKVRWVENTVQGKRMLVPATAPEQDGPGWVIGQKNVTNYEGPVAECVDVFDWIWDPNGHSIDTIRWAIHRMWMDDEAVKDRFDRGAWELPEGVTLDDVLSNGAPDDGRNGVWQARMEAGGYSGDTNKASEKLHEVWEYHDGQQVITVVDRLVPVQQGRNPFWHMGLPFQIFRPTEVLHEMVGIGEPEAIEDLQEEMNEFRSMRRDNATLVLQRPFAYFDGLVDPADFQMGAGAMWPVDGDPRELIFPLPVQDLPGSSYQETQGMERDIERVTGIDDTVSGAEGGGGASATATGVQLVQAAAGLRIQNKTRRLELECVGPQAEQFLELTQQKILTSQFIAGPPRPGEITHRAWAWYEVGPKQLAGQWEIQPIGGSMSPPSPVEKMDKANRVMQAFGNNPLVKQDKVIEFALDNYGVDNPRSWIQPQEPTFAPEDLALVAEGIGMSPEQLVGLATEAQAMRERQEAMAQQALPGGGAQDAAPPAEPQPGT